MFRPPLADDLEVRTTDKSRERALQLSLLYAVGETTIGARKLVSQFNRAVRQLFAKGIPAQQVPALVKEVGWFRKMSGAKAKRRSPTLMHAEATVWLERPQSGLHRVDEGSARLPRLV
jgi:hypothetical protein